MQEVEAGERVAERGARNRKGRDKALKFGSEAKRGKQELCCRHRGPERGFWPTETAPGHTE